MTETRKTIADTIETHPGIHFNELTRRLELAPGQVQYHVRQLLADQAVTVERLYGRTHYYPPTYNDDERRALALLQRETAGDIVAYLLVNGPTEPTVIAEDLQIARSTLEWQLKRLIDQDLVAKHQADNTVTIRIQAPELATSLLRDADPALRERLVDRFTRLIDHLLPE